MEEWLKVIVPVLLAGMGIIIYDIINDVRRIEDRQIESREYVYRIKQNEIKIEKLKERCK